MRLLHPLLSAFTVTLALAVVTKPDLTPELETVWSVKLPHKQALNPYFEASATVQDTVRVGDRLYVKWQQDKADGTTAGGLISVNLRTKSVEWTADVGGKVKSPFLVLPEHNRVVVLGRVTVNASTDDFKHHLFGLHLQTGAVDWTSDTVHQEGNNWYHLNFTAQANSDIAALSTIAQVHTFNVTNGELGRLSLFNSSILDFSSQEPSVAYVRYPHTIGAEALFSGRQLWTKTNPKITLPQIDFVVDGLVFLTTEPANSFEVQVLNGQTGAQICKLENKGYLEASFKPVVNETTITVLFGVGDENELRTYSRSACHLLSSQNKSLSAASFNHEEVPAPDLAHYFHGQIPVIRTQYNGETDVKLFFGPLSGPLVVATSFTPTSDAFHLQYYGHGVVQVGNLQGYVLWQLHRPGVNATVISRSTTAPTWIPAKTWFDGAAVITENGFVKGQQVIWKKK